jgi:transcriptional regulator with XRE-family HTH domain
MKGGDAQPPAIQRALRRYLKRHMTRQGLSLYRVSQRTGIDRKALSKMLAGTHTGPLVTMMHLAKGLGVSMGSMFTELERDLNRIQQEDDKNAKSQRTGTDVAG